MSEKREENKTNVDSTFCLTYIVTQRANTKILNTKIFSKIA